MIGFSIFAMPEYETEPVPFRELNLFGVYDRIPRGTVCLPVDSALVWLKTLSSEVLTSNVEASGGWPCSGGQRAGWDRSPRAGTSGGHLEPATWRGRIRSGKGRSPYLVEIGADVEQNGS